METIFTLSNLFVLPFWALMITFWVCGWSTNGLIATHFISAAHDHGMPPTTSAGLLALIGIFDIVGTVASGWLTDRVDSRLLLAGYYFFRGIALLVVPSVLGPTVLATQGHRRRDSGHPVEAIEDHEEEQWRRHCWPQHRRNN